MDADKLREYRDKRDPARTPEPVPGETPTPDAGAEDPGAPDDGSAATEAEPDPDGDPDGTRPASGTGSSCTITYPAPASTSSENSISRAVPTFCTAEY